MEILRNFHEGKQDATAAHENDDAAGCQGNKLPPNCALA